jgi:hypothetical protein
VLAAAVVPDEADVDEEEEQAAASRAVAPIIAATVTRRIWVSPKVLLLSFL